MDIKIGKKYVITSDSYNIILHQNKKRKEGKQKGEEYQEVLGYYPNLDNCLQALLDHDLRESQASSLRDVLDRADEVKKWIEKSLKGVKRK